MSDQSQGPGWWQASNGKWYPPELHPAAKVCTSDGSSSTGWPASSDGGSRTIRSGTGRGAVIGDISALAVVALLGGTVALVASHRGDKKSTTVATASSAPSLSDTDLASRFGDAVYRIEVNGCGVTGSGTAFAVDEHHLVTAGHVIAVDSAPKLRSRTGQVLNGRVVGSRLNPMLR